MQKPLTSRTLDLGWVIEFLLHTGMEACTSVCSRLPVLSNCFFCSIEFLFFSCVANINLWLTNQSTVHILHCSHRYSSTDKTLFRDKINKISLHLLTFYCKILKIWMVKKFTAYMESEVRYRVHKSSQLEPILIQLNPGHNNIIF